jgi:hypothetical protein
LYRTQFTAPWWPSSLIISSWRSPMERVKVGSE